MSIPSDLRYTKEHEWARIDGDVATIGITHHAQEALGDIVFVELPEVGRTLSQGETFGVVESVKAVSDLFAPLSGTVSEVNEALNGAPETLNKDPYGEGWIARMSLDKPDEIGALFDVTGYQKLLAEEAK
ncbi:MAG: glycine cleavage system protein GcvH [Pseudomonadota bacterium]